MINETTKLVYLPKHRVEMMRNMKKIRKEKSGHADTTDFQIIPYQEYHGNKVTFQTDSVDGIFILISKKTSVLYFLLLDGRIRAFDYIEKGGSGIFITY